MCVINEGVKENRAYVSRTRLHNYPSQDYMTHLVPDSIQTEPAFFCIRYMLLNKVGQMAIP